MDVINSRKDPGYFISIIIILILISFILVSSQIIKIIQDDSMRGSAQYVAFGINSIVWGVLLILSKSLFPRAIIFRMVARISPIFAPFKKISTKLQHMVIFFGLGALFIIIGLVDILR